MNIVELFAALKDDDDIIETMPNRDTYRYKFTNGKLVGLNGEPGMLSQRSTYEIIQPKQEPHTTPNIQEQLDKIQKQLDNIQEDILSICEFLEKL